MLSLLSFLVYFFGLHPVFPESLSGQFQIVQFFTPVFQLTLVVGLLILSVGGPRLQPVERSEGDTLPSNSFLRSVEVGVDDLHELLNQGTLRPGEATLCLGVRDIAPILE